MSSILTSSTMREPPEKPRPTKHRPAAKPETEAALAARRAREAAALRQNLKRRKAQTRAKRPETPECP